MGSRSLEKDFQAAFPQQSGQILQRIERRLTARDDDGLCGIGAGAVDYRIYVDRRKHPGVPCHFRIAPFAPDVTSTQTDEIGRFPGVKPFSLYGIKIFDQRKLLSAAE